MLTASRFAQETADELGLATMSDLAEVADELVWGLATGCPENPVCGPGLQDVYGIDISALDVEPLPPCSAEIAEALNSERDRRRPGLHHAGRDRELQLRPAWRTTAGSQPAQNLAPGASRRSWPMPAAMTWPATLNAVTSC